MIETLENLTAGGVRYILISGQASVLYGGAEFSEDIDIWVSPDRDNLERLTARLRLMKAEIGRLTPPIIEETAKRGHAFHFEVPESDGTVWPLDVLGAPPRVGPFDEAYREAESPLSRLPGLRVLDPFRLVEIKKTDRERDYPIIAALVERIAERWTKDPETQIPRGGLEWIIEESRSPAPLYRLMDRIDFRPVVEKSRRRAIEAVRDAILRGRDLNDDETDRFIAALDEEKRLLQRANRVYWRPIIEELKEMRRRGELLPKGLPVGTARGSGSRD